MEDTPLSGSVASPFFRRSTRSGEGNAASASKGALYGGRWPEICSPCAQNRVSESLNSKLRGNA